MMEITAAGDDHKALRKIAAALLAKATSGDVPAINSLADWTDGKVAQALIGDSEEDGVRLEHTRPTRSLALLLRRLLLGLLLLGRLRLFARTLVR